MLLHLYQFATFHLVAGCTCNTLQHLKFLTLEISTYLSGVEVLCIDGEVHDAQRSQIDGQGVKLPEGQDRSALHYHPAPGISIMN